MIPIQTLPSQDITPAEVGTQIHTIGVLGAGTMGNGIAQLIARAGFEVLLYDQQNDILQRALERITGNLVREVEKGRLSEGEKSQSLGRIHPTLELENLRRVDFLMEAVSEIFATKAGLFESLDKLCPSEVIFASNTSSISITRLAAGTARPDRFIGMHFFNPVPVMKLVEIVRGMATSEETFRTTQQLARRLGKEPIEVRDQPGFVSNRVLMPMINEAVFCVMEGVATPEAVDGVMKLGMNHPMGPLELADLIGLDVCLNILEVLYEGFGDSKYRPCPLLRKMVDAGWLGRKSGRGFYNYKP